MLFFWTFFSLKNPENIQMYYDFHMFHHVFSENNVFSGWGDLTVLCFLNYARVFQLKAWGLTVREMCCVRAAHRCRLRWLIKHQISKSRRVDNTDLSAGLVLCLLMLASSFQNAKTLCTLVACGSNRRCSLMRLFYSPAWPRAQNQLPCQCHAQK